MENRPSSKPEPTTGKRPFESAAGWATLVLSLTILVHESREIFHRCLRRGIVRDEINFLSGDVHTAIQRGNNPESNDDILNSYNALDALTGAQGSMWKMYQDHASCFERTDAESKRLELARQSINQKIESGIREFNKKLHIGTSSEIERPRPIRARTPASTVSSDTSRCEEMTP